MVVSFWPNCPHEAKWAALQISGIFMSSNHSLPIEKHKLYDSIHDPLLLITFSYNFIIRKSFQMFGTCWSMCLTYIVAEVTNCKQADIDFRGHEEIYSEPGGVMDYEEDRSRPKR